MKRGDPGKGGSGGSPPSGHAYGFYVSLGENLILHSRSEIFPKGELGHFPC